jgi:CP family cyanate transporter-like MFS transporter
VSRRRLATAATLIFVALNLRMAIAAVPPVLTQIQRDTGLGSAGSGLLTALPLFCFGAMASSAPALVRRLRMGPLLGLTMAVVALGCAVRLVPGLAALFVGTAIVGSGIAVANVLLIALALGYIVGRAHDDHHVAHLSTMAQGVGYLIASTGPFVVGALHGVTSSWTVPLLVLLGALVPLLAAGIVAGREGQVLAGADLAGAEDLEPAR